jgi:hypothetical protein
LLIFLSPLFLLINWFLSAVLSPLPCPFFKPLSSLAPYVCFEFQTRSQLTRSVHTLSNSPLSPRIDMHLFVPATRAEVETDVALYIGLAVACAVFTLVAVFIFRLLRRKGRDHSMYNMTASGKRTGSAVTVAHLKNIGLGGGGRGAVTS